MTKAVILCGGQGTRIRDASETLPKPMLPIGNRPIVWHIMKGYETYGVSDFVLCLGYRGWLFKEFFLNYSAIASDITVRLGQGSPPDFLERVPKERWNVTLADTGDATQTGGRVAMIRRYVQDDDIFCLTYGDGVGNIDIRASIEFHRRHGKIATVTAVRPPSRFGEMRTENDTVREFNEKPQSTDGFINGGFFVLDARRIWDYIGDDVSTAFEDKPLQTLASRGELVAYRHTGFWQPMDTPREYNLLNGLWTAGRAPWNTWDLPEK